MLNKLQAFLKEQQMLQPGDRVVCAVSGGADSMALLWAMYLLKDKLNIHLSAAHFDHHLRGEESERDRAFVETFCRDYSIPCVTGEGNVVAGAKGLEAAAREARYAFFDTLEGKIATAHTADDNAETILMHLIRGTGLKGMGGISPKRGKLIRPMLMATRQDVEKFLAEYSIPYVTDSSNTTDAFLRNRIRHNVIPLLKEENPNLAQNLSATALRLRQDEAALELLSERTDRVSDIRQKSPAVQSRVICKLLKDWGIKEPESEHIRLVKALVDGDNPSAAVSLPGNMTVAREYNRLILREEILPITARELNCPGITEVPELGMRFLCLKEAFCEDGFSVDVQGKLILRSRRAGDKIRLPGGTKELKKLFIDRKIPAAHRCRIPVLADDAGVLGIPQIGVNLDRTDPPRVTIRWEYL